MPIYRFIFLKPAIKFLKRQEKKVRIRIYRAVYNIPNGDIKKLQGSNLYRLRVGSYRVIFFDYCEV